jgi:uncharacterized protein
MASTQLLRPQIDVFETLTPLSQNAQGIQSQAVAAFANVYNIGPMIPTFCNSWQTFVQNYGNFNVANGNPLHFAVYSYFANGGTGCYVLRVPNTDAAYASVITNDIEGGGGQPLATWTAVSKGVWGSSVYIGMTAVSTGHVNVIVYSGGTAQVNIVEQWLNVSANPNDPRYAPNIINSPNGAGSNYINVVLAYHGGTYTAGSTDFGPLSSPVQLTGGSDGVVNPAGGAFGGIVTSLFDQYVQQQVVNINLPGQQAASDINTLVTWAQGREDVFVLADGPTPSFPETSTQVVGNYVNLVSGGASIAPSSFVAVYAPYLLIQDPSSSSIGATRYVGPCGSILGAMCQTDTLVGVQQTTAGSLYGKIACVGLEVQFMPSDLDTLALNNVNAIKNVPGTGFCVFGGRTLQFGFPSMYVAVRRVLMKVEHDSVILLQPFLFQPNGPNLWAAISTVLNNYLNTQTLAGLFSTTDVTQAYVVTCDSTNNTSSTAQSGIVNITMAVALGSPAEYIIMNIQQVNGTTTITSAQSTA